MSEQPLVQVSTVIKQGDIPQVVVRVSSVPEIEEAEEMLNALQERLLAAMATVVSTLRGTPGNTAEAVSNLQAAGLSPQVVSQTPPPAAPAPSAPPSSGISQCPACSRKTECPECGGATLHGVKASKAGAKYNAHMCVQNDRHKVVWCKTPIPAGLAVAVGNNPALVY